METNIAARERAVFAVLVDDLHDWIAMLLHTPTSPTPLAFFDWIHDGTVLLSLLSAVDSQFTASVQTRARSCSAAASEFQARDNLARFLKGCKSIGVPDVCLFAPDDLVDNKNHKAVVNALLQLARVAARKFGTTPPATIAAELEIEACEAAAEAAVKPVNTEFHTDAAGWQTGVRVPMQPELLIATAPAFIQSEAPTPLTVSEPEFDHAQLIASPVALVAHIVRVPSTPAQPNKPLPLSPVDTAQAQSIALKEPTHGDEVSIVIQLDLSGAALAAHAAKESQVVEPSSNDANHVPPTSAPSVAVPATKSLHSTPARSASSRPTSAAAPTPMRTPARTRLNQDPIDTAVQQVLDQLAHQDRSVSVTASALKSRSRASSPMPAARVQRLATGCYLVNGERKVYVRLIRDVLMARVGGGWQDFFCFLLRYQIDHAHAIEGTMEVRDLNSYVAGRPEQGGYKL